MTAVHHNANDVHQFLLDPRAYPDRPARVELKETHISWVYLTDRFVYKQKKPVKFEFLDFSTLERRRYFCQQEVRLNRRFSPEVYLGVVPVTANADGVLQLKEGSDVVEWLVRMVRLDDDRTLEKQIVKGTLTETDVQRLSQRLSRFYECQPPATLVCHDFLETLRQHVTANRDDLLRTQPQLQQAILFSTSSQLRCLFLEAEYFVERVCDGRVVDGHGDLRPEHIYLGGPEPVIIDCLEFNEEYRTNDVIDELSFLSMECELLGNQTLEKALTSAYRKSTGDAPRSFLGAFYKSYRACVRAKVAALRSGQQSGAQLSDSVQESHRYLDLANRYAAALGQKLVIIMGGLMGTGKSTLALKLQESLAAELLRTDAIRDEFFARQDGTGYGVGKYSAQGRQQVYDAMMRRIGNSLRRSPCLILDGSFAETANRQAAADAAAAHGAVVLQVQCDCPAEEALRRISNRISRGGSASEARPELYAQQAAAYQTLLPCEDIARIDTRLPIASQLTAVMLHVRRLVSI